MKINNSVKIALGVITAFFAVDYLVNWKAKTIDDTITPQVKVEPREDAEQSREITATDPNKVVRSSFGFHGPWEYSEITPNHINPEDLLEYKITSLENRTLDNGLLGKIMSCDFGYYKKGKFIKSNALLNYHVEKSEDIFSEGNRFGTRRDYGWQLKIKKPENKREENIMGCYFVMTQYVKKPIRLCGFRIYNKKVSSEKIFVIPTKDHGDWYEAQVKIITVHNKGINGHYYMEGDSNSLRSVIHVPQGHVLGKLKK